MLRVFVYGTLKPGGFYYGDYCEGRTIAETPAWVRGWLYDLPLGYPAMVVDVDGDSVGELGQGDRVWGYLLTFADPEEGLAALDELEDYDPHGDPSQNLYQRYWLPVFGGEGQALGHAWVYGMRAERVPALGGRYLSQGVWEVGTEIR
jgi:gamma-glutamylcyclotransferase (GGCT)/AIG2-like uncharacterized protein YtfP